MTGLLAARALSDFAAKVTIVERDRFAAKAERRKGVPQCAHNHLILPAAANALEEYFPGFWERMIARGTVALDVGSDMLWYHHGVWKIRTPANMLLYGQTQPLLEWGIRQELAAYKNIEWLDGCRATGFLHDPASKRITGVTVERLDESKPETFELAADLVIDGTGRGSRTSQWLEALGFEPPAEEEYKVDVVYTTRIVRLPESASRDWKFMLISPRAPQETRLGGIMCIEGGCHQVSIGGYFNDPAPTDDKGFLEYAKTLPHPEFYEAIKDAEPVTEPVRYHFPANFRRYYERMKSIPDGLVVLGDAVCCYNPVFGQGMTMAALGSTALRDSLREVTDGNLQGFPQKVYKKNTAFINVAWNTAAGEDWRYPQVAGKRPFGLKFIHWFSGQILEVSAFDAGVHDTFLRVAGFLAPETEFFKPRILGKVLGWNAKKLVARAKTDPWKNPPRRQAV